jgi:hypothetical protein
MMEQKKFLLPYGGRIARRVPRARHFFRQIAMSLRKMLEFPREISKLFVNLQPKRFKHQDYVTRRKKG